MNGLSLRSGLVSVTYRTLAPCEIVARAAACGLEAIEWGGDVHVQNAAEARPVRAMTEDAGLAVAAFGSYWRAVGDFGPTLETAVALGAPTIRVWAGDQGSAAMDDRRPTVDALRGACVQAADAGKTVSLEYHGGTLTDTLASTLSLVQEVDHPVLRLYWQPVPERSLTTRLAEVRAVLPWLSNLHVFQWSRPQGETIRHPLSEGEEEWRPVFELAEGVARYALLEFVPGDDPERLATEAATLRRWLGDDR